MLTGVECLRRVATMEAGAGEGLRLESHARAKNRQEKSYSLDENYVSTRKERTGILREYEELLLLQFFVLTSNRGSFPSSSFGRISTTLKQSKSLQKSNKTNNHYSAA